jgi:hypothetical protein
MEQGTVKWFNDAKSYGFISRQTGEDCFRTLLGYQGRRLQLFLRHAIATAQVATVGNRNPQVEKRPAEGVSGAL